MTSTSDHLRRALSADAARPRITFYDDATGERVELSTTTLANWVAKTVNLLRISCGVEEGARVLLHLPRHWTLAVWVLAADAVGAEILDTPDGGSLDVAVVGPEAVDGGDGPVADELFAVSLAPLAAPFAVSLPPWIRDFHAEVRTMPDQAGPPTPGGGPDRLGDLAEATAGEWGLRPADRVASGGSGDAALPLSSVAEEFLAPLAAGASVVWTRNQVGDRCVARWGAERVTAVRGEVPNGLAVPESIRILP